MDDKFLYQNRPLVRSGFSENLYAHISNMTVQNTLSPKRVFTFTLKFILASMSIFALILIFSEPVRAGVLNWFKSIAGFKVMDTAPDFNNPFDKVAYPITVTMDEVLQNSSFPFSIPTYLPDGYESLGGVNDEGGIALVWAKGFGIISFSVTKDWDVTIQANLENSEEIQINGQSALLIRGAWNENGEWVDTKKRTDLTWRKDGLIYFVSSSVVDPPSDALVPASEVLSDEELIKIAESIK
ncbi:MAG: DUF4367 domain-containing protein [Chloroflexi bacterium]|nr:DUF4367 domain-containing protein [Chloroflexota bacterium]